MTKLEPQKSTDIDNRGSTVCIPLTEELRSNILRSFFKFYETTLAPKNRRTQKKHGIALAGRR